MLFVVDVMFTLIVYGHLACIVMVTLLQLTESCSVASSKTMYTKKKEFLL